MVTLHRTAVTNVLNVRELLIISWTVRNATFCKWAFKTYGRHTWCYQTITRGMSFDTNDSLWHRAQYSACLSLLITVMATVLDTEVVCHVVKLVMSLRLDIWRALNRSPHESMHCCLANSCHNIHINKTLTPSAVNNTTQQFEYMWT